MIHPLRLAAWLGLLALTGCAHWHTLPTAPNYPANGPSTDWTATGKLGIRTADSRDTVHFLWQHQKTGFTLRLSAPVGGQQAVILAHNGLVTAALPDGRIAHADTPELLLQQLYGWGAPVSSLAFWVRGLPDPALPGQPVPTDDAGSRRWQQAGWQLTWSQYRPFGDAALPGRIDIEGPDALRLTILIQDWQWPGRAPAGNAP